MDSRLDILRGSLQTFLLAIGLSYASLALPQEVGTPDSLATEPVTAAVVQLLAVGPGAEDKNRECAATGFLVNEEGYLLTNAHVIADARRCLAASPGTKIMAKLARPGARAAPAVSCDVVALDDLHDLALLKTERPLVFERGKGIFIYDENGKDYIESVSCFYCVSLGFSEERLVDAATRQLKTLPMYSSAIHRTVPPVMELTERLAALSPVK
ncbi:MAG: aminotransferase class III-fold pyridoxal phosphate-dependent enzyme, partial [Acidobacteriia bacterium]|nr:aminotransferase class III-fold pyridoxal phosphate-dependent enzyme [Terriglobia bacterium]